MEQDVYEKLRLHFNQGSMSKLRRTSELMEILRMFFSEEQVEYALAIPLVETGRIGIEELAGKMNRESALVEEKVEAMARTGTVMVTIGKKDNRKYYALWSLMPGIIENSFVNSTDNDQRRRLIDLWNKYLPEALWPEFASSNYPQGRIIPVNKVLELSSDVLPFEEVNRMIEAASVMTIIPCMCKIAANNCKHHLLEVCMIFGDWAEYLIQYRGARRWSKEEVLQRLRDCETDGLAHVVGNAQKGRNHAICNCCSCCCHTLKGLTEQHNSRSFSKSNYSPKFVEGCTLCLQCENICPVGAITKLPGYEADGSDTRMRVEETACIGCGLCANACPVEVIQMKKVRNVIPVENYHEMRERFLKEKIY